jgi:putative transposase
MASNRLPAVLAVEIFAGWPTTTAGELRQLIAAMAAANRTWGEERIASELLVKLGIRISPRTVRRYMSAGPGTKKGSGSQAWSSFVPNHARAVLACDFFVTVTATFRVLYIFVVLEVGTRRILHWNVTEHPTAEWTIQQFRMLVPGDQSQRFVVHDHDSIHSEGVDRTIAAMGLTVLKTPVRAPQANAFCERLIGMIRRECLDFVIPLNERHVRRLLLEWVARYNRGRPHTSLDQAFPIRRTIASHYAQAAIRFVMVIASSRRQSSADCTTSTISSR